MSDKVRIKLFIGTGFANCAHEDYQEVDRAEWEAMTEAQRDEYLEDAAQTYLSNHVEYCAYVVDAD